MFSARLVFWRNAFLRTLACFAPVVMATSVASAQAAAPAGGGPSMLPPMIGMLVVFGFFVIWPQMKKQKEHQKLLSSLKRGDDVLTSSGLLGRIEGITETFVTLEIAQGVRVKVLRSQITALFTPTEVKV